MATAVTTPDISIIGGGVVGSSIAFNLLQDGFKGAVTVIERDSSYQFASSALAFGGVRQQFMSRVNIQMVQYSLGTIAQFPECGFHPRGYLFLGNESNWNKLKRRYEIQKSLGAECELLDVAGIRKLVPECFDDRVQDRPGNRLPVLLVLLAQPMHRLAARAFGARLQRGEVFFHQD